MKTDLSGLPRTIVKLNKHWWKDLRTGKWIPSDRITDYLPKPTPSHEDIIAKRYDLKY